MNKIPVNMKIGFIFLLNKMLKKYGKVKSPAKSDIFPVI